MGSDEKMLLMLETLVTKVSSIEEGQARLEKRQTKLEEGQSRLEEGQARLEKRQTKLEQGQAETNQRIDKIEMDVAYVKENLSHTKILIEHDTNRLIRLVSEKQDVMDDKINQIQPDVKELKGDFSLVKSVVSTNVREIKNLKMAK